MYKYKHMLAVRH